MKIQTKVLVALVAVVSVTGAGTTIVSRNISKNMIEKEIGNRLENAARSRAQNIETFLEAQKEAVKQLSESIVIERVLIADMKDQDYFQKRDDVFRRLERTSRIGEYTYDIFVLDSDGIIVTSSDEEDIGKDKSDDLYFLGGKQNVFIKDAYVSAHKGRHTLAFSAPVFDEGNRKFVGVVVIRISTERLNEITVDRTGLGETGEIYLVNRDGYMITPSRFVNDAFLKRKVDTENARSCIGDGQLFGTQEHKSEVILCRNYLCSDVLGVHAYIPEMKWRVLAETSAKEAFAPVARLTHMMLSIFAALLIGGAVLSVVLSRTLTRAIVKLHHGTEEIERGNLDYKVGTQARDEIGQLSRSFDIMTARLKKSKEELEEYSRGLEQKVAERTAQLKEQFTRSEQQKMAMLNISQDLEETNKNLQAEITERKRAEEAQREWGRKMGGLLETAHSLESCRAEDEIYRLTVKAAEKILTLTMCTLDIVEGNKLVVKATSSELPRQASTETDLYETSLASKTHKTGKSILFNKLDEVPEARPTREEFKSGISAPIGDIGVFQVVSTEPGAFSEDDVKLLELLLGHTIEAVRRIRLQEKLREQATRDPLTGAYNRRHFRETIEKELERSKRHEHSIGFLMIDVDKFKQINDKHGHQTGDRVLQEIAAFLQTQVRAAEMIVRYGGDEFLIVMPELKDGTDALKQRLTEELARWNETKGTFDFPVRLSVGDAVWDPDSSESVEEVLASADQRMYQAKRNRATSVESAERVHH